MILALDHVQLAMPRGREAEARAFFVGILGFAEDGKPPRLAARGGLWLRQGRAHLHLGVEDSFAPARRAHPAFEVDDLADLARRLTEAGYPPVEDEPLPGCERFYVSDPFGNRIEFLERISAAREA